jgi:hypothetical protein
MKAYLSNNLNYFNFPVFLYIVIGLAFPLFFEKGFEISLLVEHYNAQLNAIFSIMT